MSQKPGRSAGSIATRYAAEEWRVACWPRGSCSSPQCRRVFDRLRQKLPHRRVAISLSVGEHLVRYIALTAIAKTTMYIATVPLIADSLAWKIFWKRRREGRYMAPHSGPKKPAAVTTPRMKRLRLRENAEYRGGNGAGSLALVKDISASSIELCRG
jgi:hypothetical protein